MATRTAAKVPKWKRSFLPLQSTVEHSGINYFNSLMRTVTNDAISYQTLLSLTTAPRQAKYYTEV